MGFWSGISKIIQGKPVFENPDVPGGPDTLKEQEAETLTASTESDGRKVIPALAIEQCESSLNGAEMEVWVWITNQSSVAIELDKIVMIGMTLELDRVLQPGEAKEVRLYKGKVPTSSSYGAANLYYKQVRNGDYFRADFRVEYDYDPQGYYMVDELHPIYPIRDI